MSSESQSSGNNPPSVPNGKGTTTPPKVTRQDASVELKSMKPEREGVKGAIPLGEDIMQIARIGEIPAMQRIFEEKKLTANYKDEEGITPLHVRILLKRLIYPIVTSCVYPNIDLECSLTVGLVLQWAAINNQYAMCKFLLDSGADVNAKGGESVATPAMWAAQRCHYYIVHLLLQQGADPLLTDVQGYNILHLATIDGNAFLLVLLLHQEIPVDVADQQGHTGLMWAAYKGYPACVDLFLRWGANPNTVDESGLAPLHWALVKGSLPCVQKLVEYGADRFARTQDGKTPAIVASDMNTVRVWYRALDECGYDFDGNTKVLPMGMASWARNKSIMSKFFFLWPFLMVFVAVWILSNMAIYFSIPATLVALFGLQWVAQKAASQAPSEYRVLQRTVSSSMLLYRQDFVTDHRTKAISVGCICGLFILGWCQIRSLCTTR